MPEFYREAILAATCSEPSDRNNLTALDSWSQVAEALDKLNPRQRCDAIYADWLLQLHAPGGATQIQIRDLLLGEGALAADFLAELAQNADDSEASALLVALEDDWLLVANNGRPLSSLNLLGLCRFFIHSNGKVVGLTPETIGRFGIGFKACHRVAEEVFVWSWGANEFGFRLPICHRGGLASHPETGKLNALVQRLEALGEPIVNLHSQEKLGHCTPEALAVIPDTLPARLVERMNEFKSAHRTHGVWFALHLHENGQAEAASRITDQADSLYGLCPLFLNHLRSVTLQDRTMRMAVGTALGKNTVTASAKRITLEITESDGKTRNDKLLLLNGQPGTKWKLALPTDSDFKIKRPQADQFSLRSGGGYAFFPLPSLIWPWQIHLHLACRTNLARSDWNADDQETTRSNLLDAGQSLAAWATQNTDLWHTSWQPADILTRSPTDLQEVSSARVFADAYQEALSAEPSLRTLWGSLTTPKRAIGLKVTD